MKVGSLFSGIGGFDLAAKNVGWEPVWFSEIDQAAIKIYQAHFPKSRAVGNIAKWTPDPKKDKVDIIMAGFPCQDLSLAGKGKGIEGERSGLFWHIIRLAEQLDPKWILLENVPGLISSKHGDDFTKVISALVGTTITFPPAKYGRYAQRRSGVAVGPKGIAVWRILDSRYFGVPQRRRRWYCLVDRHPTDGSAIKVLIESQGGKGNIKESREKRQSPTKISKRSLGTEIARIKTLRQSGITASGVPALTFLDDIALPITNINDQVLFANTIDAGEWRGPNRNQIGTIVVFDETQITSKTNRSNPKENDVCHTLASSGRPPTIGGTLLPRRLTPIECERLQGFPDNWTNVANLKDTPRYKALGNAVSVPVIEWILGRLKELINTGELNS